MSDREQNVYFRTDKIYKLDDLTWKKIDLRVDGNILNFYPVAQDDIWYSVNLTTNNSMLYHAHGGITENVQPPFSNQISNIRFISDNKAVFASFSDLALYENGAFRLVPRLPFFEYVYRIYCKDLNAIWLVTNVQKLFFLEHGNFRTILDGKKITDFWFRDIRDGYILAGGELYQVKGPSITLICKNKMLENIRRIYGTADGSLVMAGSEGLILEYTGGKLVKDDIPYRENLTDVLVTGSGDVWISGEAGTLLYSGSKKFPPYIEDNRGFSSFKLIHYSINTVDEYGVALADFNGDMKPDIYAVRIYEQNRLYINTMFSSNSVDRLNGFSEEAIRRNATGVINQERATVVHAELKLGICVADIDNDGDQDIYLCYLNSKNKLLINRGNGFFRNVSEQKSRGCENMLRSNAAAMADVDLDGDLDLFVTNEEGTNRLFENNGTGSFTDITVSSGLSSARGGMCATFGDVNGDGLPDLCVTFWYPSNKLYINESTPGKIRFRDATSKTDIGLAPPAKSNGVALADVNNDGFPDLFIANRNTGNKFYLNDGKGNFRDKTAEFFPEEKFMSNGVVFADFDLDGYLDLYLTNVGDNVLYKNMQGSCFQDVTAEFGAELSGYCTGSAVGDVDNDGDPDLYVANYVNGNSKLFMNVTERRNFVKLYLHGVRSNKDAIGTKVWLFRDAAAGQPPVLAGFREMTNESGYSSVSAREMIFGVEPGFTYHVLVKFPCSADTLRLTGIRAGTTLSVDELTGIKAFTTECRNKFINFFTDRENQPEIIKFLTVLALLMLYNVKYSRSFRKIGMIRLLSTGVIFMVYLVLNQFFLFQGLSVQFFIAPAVAFGLLVILDLVISRILLRRVVEKEKLDLREKLSRDLHDDLASTLGSISIYAETLRGADRNQPEPVQKLLAKIASLTHTALQSITDIIWMTSPRHDSLQSLISKTSNYIFELLTDNNIAFRSVIDISDNPLILSERMRNDAFLIMKEALHNLIRHSAATEVEFSAGIQENTCIIILKDNGTGFNENEIVTRESHGNGLVNMRRRAREAKIDLDIISAAGKGTEIVMKFRI